MREATNMYPNLIDQQQFRLNKINETNDYFIVYLQQVAAFPFYCLLLLLLHLYE